MATTRGGNLFAAQDFPVHLEQSGLLETRVEGCCLATLQQRLFFYAWSDARPMRLFECQFCGQPLYFENTFCESCGHRLGFSASLRTLSAVDWADGAWIALADPSRPFRFCANAKYDVCNWLVAADGPDPYCVACRHNRVIPNLSRARNVERWRRLEVAKRRLFYTLLKLDLPIIDRSEDPHGLAFDFLSDPAEGTTLAPTILTGHDNGLITINIAEADDAERERRRQAMGEPYRTLLGHFRHEIAHYYWDVLVGRDESLESFRLIFGDERQDYGAALRKHYATGPPVSWRTRFVSAYASAHPWEDWAETWAHYLHLIDTLETASAFGLSVRPQMSHGRLMSAAIDFDPHDVGDLNRLVAAWAPLTFAVNSLNRSMGQPDLYPFVLAPTVIGKLAFVHERIYAATGRDPGSGTEADLLKAIAAGLRNRPPMA